MINLRDVMANLNTGNLVRLDKLVQSARRNGPAMKAGLATATLQPVPPHLREVRDFGSNPGNLRMLTYLPENLPSEAALVVVLHGCTQTAEGYDLGAGWSTIADRYGFALLLPEQQRSNNPNNCFNWFQPEDSQRDRGEALSIRQMIETIAVDQRIDRRRIFITGLSAGGAMTSVMLACYPEVFAGGAIIAGLPFGAATNVQQAFESMFQSPARPAREWGDLVRKASPHAGPWPRVSVWHGSVDTTVIPPNADEIIKQWTDVHGLAIAPSRRVNVDGHPREVWTDGNGAEQIESYTIANMAHGTPLATSEAVGACGEAGPFLLQVGISSSYHIAKFFNLAVAHPRESQRAQPSEAFPAPGLKGTILDKDFDQSPNRAANTRRPPSSPFEIGTVIAKALKAAGLMRP
ncbi:MAG: PHB depolymerase family esterase [Alphaproteobacteria bacterium]|nr:PHB depolymerase family esterase [Alphaproteobacteria bacterium]